MNKSCFRQNTCLTNLLISRSLTWWIQALVCVIKFKDLQAPALFSSTSKALYLGEKIQGCVGTLYHNLDTSSDSTYKLTLHQLMMSSLTGTDRHTDIHCQKQYLCYTAYIWHASKRTQLDMITVAYCQLAHRMRPISKELVVEEEKFCLYWRQKLFNHKFISWRFWCNFILTGFTVCDRMSAYWKK